MSDEDLRALMDELETLHLMLAAAVTPPFLVELAGKKKFRYGTRGPRQAVVQKLAYALSLLNGSAVLIEAGFVQEAAVLGRVLDDVSEEVRFLCHALLVGDPGEIDPDGADDIDKGVLSAQGVLRKLLDNFYAEMIDDRTDTVGSLLRKRRPVGRRELRQALEQLSAKILQNAGAPTDSAASLTRLSQAVGNFYHSYVHAGSPQIMESFGGSPPRFQVRGLLDTSLMAPHVISFWQRIEKYVLGFQHAGMAFGLPQVAQRARTLHGDTVVPHLAKLGSGLMTT